MLFADLINSARNLEVPRIANHFFGSVILRRDQSTDIKEVIDGQQRIMTVFLLLAAMRDCLRDGNIRSSDPVLDRRIDDGLHDMYDPLKVYLKPVERDRGSYNAIICHIGTPEETSCVTINYRHFMDLLSSLPSDVDCDLLYQALNRLQVIVIRLKDGDDAQAIFESINSTGLDLSEADKIRNFVLMNHLPKRQEYLYRKYWLKIEENIPDVGVLSDFFRDFLMAVSRSKVTVTNTYREFKEYVIGRVRDGSYSEDIEAVLADIVAYSEIYLHLLRADLSSISREASKPMRYINRMGITVSYPFFMCLIHKHNEDPGAVTVDDVVGSLNLVENFLVRRLVCNRYSTGMNSFFASLYPTVVRVRADVPFYEKLKHYLIAKTGAMAFVTNAEVRYGFDTVDLYRSNKTAASVVLALVEDANLDVEDVLGRIPGSLSIEHIMPQNKTPAWRAMVGEDYDEVYARWLNKLGNLTLTAYNANLGDRPFGEKLHHEFGYLASTLHLNDFARSNPGVWTEKEIEERHRKLVGKFLEIMPMPTSSVKVESDTEDYSLEEDSELFRYLIVRGCDFMGTEMKGNFKSLFLKIVKVLYDRDPEIIMRKVDVPGSNFASDKSAVGSEGAEIAPGVFVRNQFNNRHRVEVLRDILSWYGLPPSDLIIHFNKKDRDARSDAESI